MSTMRFVQLVIVCLLSFPLAAQQEPEPSSFLSPFPHTGAWFSVDDSRTGLFLDIQAGRVAGVYFGFNGVGENVWLTFSGELATAVSVDGGIDRILFNAPLMQGANGGCILNCDELNLLTPHTATQVGSITVGFNGRSSARFNIDNGPLINIVPLYFGTSAIIREFGFPGNLIPPNGLFAQPDLQGEWVIAQGVFQPAIGANPDEINLAEASGIVEIGPQQVFMSTPEEPLPMQVQMMTKAPIIRDTLQVFPDDAEIVCTYFQSAGSALNSFNCLVVGDNFGTREDGSEFTADIPIQFMSDSRFLVTIRSNLTFIAPPPVTRVEAFRIGYD